MIDIETWERKEYFLHYYNDVRCTYSITINIDITKIYDRAHVHGLRLYPTLIWWIANAVNHFEFLRFNHDSNCFDISSLPWIEFTSFNLNVFTPGTHLPPIITTGKLIKRNNEVTLPFCLQVHHSCGNRPRHSPRATSRHFPRNTM